MAHDAPSVGMVYPVRPHDATRDAGANYGHPAHRGFARAVNAMDIRMASPEVPSAIDSPMVSDLVSAMVSPIPERDVYILENDSVLYLAPRIRRTFPDSTIVLLAAGDRLIDDRAPVRAERATRYPETDHTEPQADRVLLRKFLTGYCDGVIAVSEVVADRIRPFTTPTIPVRVVTPYIQPARYERLKAVKPDLASTVAVTVGQWRDHKGVDTLVEAWPTVRDRHPTAELRIVGPGHPDRYAETEGVTVCGFVDDIETELSNASLYVHPAHIEAFGVSVVEAMCAGLPAVVTETTGARVAVRDVDDSLLTTPTSSAVAAAVSRYFATDIGRRAALSKRSRTASEPYTEAVQTQRFREQFRLLLESIPRGQFVPPPTDGG